MSLSHAIAAELDDLVQTHAPPTAITAEHGPHRLVVPVGLATEVGFECEGFRFQVADRDLAPSDLKAWGERLAAKVTYLMEPLAIHEADAVAGEVVVRSNQPTARGGKRSYYEAKLHRSGLMKFDRVAFAEEARHRRVTSCHFTNEVFDRLVDDLVATAP